MNYNFPSDSSSLLKLWWKYRSEKNGNKNMKNKAGSISITPFYDVEEDSFNCNCLNKYIRSGIWSNIGSSFHLYLSSFLHLFLSEFSEFSRNVSLRHYFQTLETSLQRDYKSLLTINFQIQSLYLRPKYTTTTDPNNLTKCKRHRRKYD